MQQPTRPEEIRLIRPAMNLSISIKKEPLTPSASKQLQSPSDLDSPSRRKKLHSLKKADDVQFARSELNSYLDLLDGKVSKLVEKHEAEFLVAYRNHIKKVREQMEEIRNKALNNANSTVSHTQKIQALQKQLTIFRDESLKLFEKVNQKQSTIYTLKSKILDLETQNSFLQRSLRQLTKRNKQLQGLNYQMEAKKSEQTTEKQFFISRPQIQSFLQSKKPYQIDISKPSTSFVRSRPYTTAINSKQGSMRSRHHSIQVNSSSKDITGLQHNVSKLVQYKIDEILTSNTQPQLINKLKQQITGILQDQPDKRKIIRDLGFTEGLRQDMNKTFNKSKRVQSFIESKIYAQKSQLQEYFVKSIESVRKQITRRRGLKSTNFYSEYANLSISEFRKLDFFRLLELLLSNDKIINAVHKAIFELPKQY